MRNHFEDGPDDYDVEVDRSRGFSVRSGRIILLGDGTEILTNHDDEEMFDHVEEDRDITNQTQHESPDATRSEREGTPGPQSQGNGAAAAATTTAPEVSSEGITESPASANATETSEDPSSVPEKSSST